MNVRDLKLAIACGHESDEVKALNIFFDMLFNLITIYQRKSETDFIFMRGDRFIMEQVLESGDLLCRYDGFWRTLEEKYGCIGSEIYEIIQYKMEEKYGIGFLKPRIKKPYNTLMVEEDFKCGLFIPYNKI